jgi:hypothetical protein
MNTKSIITIDPGKTGGIVYSPRGSVLYTVNKMPESDGDLGELLEAHRDDSARYDNGLIVYLEQVGGFIAGKEKRQPGSAMFKFGQSYGYIQGLCHAYKMPLVLVPPARWQRGLQIPTRGTNSADQHKRNLKAEAQRRHPELSKITLATCDAILMMDWAIKIERSGE